jgi:MFS family permease
MTTNERTNSPNAANAHEEKKMDMKSKLSTLWIFAALNYLYCDVVSLMDPELLPLFLRGNVNGLELTPGFLLGAGVLVEIPIAMVLLSRVLPYRTNRWANIAAGTVMTAVQSATLLVGVPAPYYLFFSVIEIATTVLIVWFAWNWREPVAQVELNEPELLASRR